MSIHDEFNEKGYVSIRKFVDEDTCTVGDTLLRQLFREGKLENDSQCPKSGSVYGDPLFDDLLERLTPHVSNIVGKDLVPTYSYARLYHPGEVLEAHTDRPACEYSVTLQLGVNGDPWPVIFDGKTLTLENAGDCVVYKGCEVVHERKEYRPSYPTIPSLPAGDRETISRPADVEAYTSQVFLHYVDKNGPYADEAFDKRPHLGAPAQTKPDDCVSLHEPIHYWEFPNVMDNQLCSAYMESFNNVEMKQGRIGSENDDQRSINTEIRNVENVEIDIGSNLGAMLMGYGMLANQQAWRYDIYCGNQIEYLKYGVGGKYLSHLDAYPMIPTNDVRKLTVLLFLDEPPAYQGGKMYLQVQEEKMYPTQTAGTVIVFPSYSLHGVEAVTEGVRNAVVCWINGPSLR